MNQFADLAEIMKEMMNGNFELSSFLSLYNDLTRGMVALDTTFDNQLIGATMNQFMNIFHVFSILGEKGLVIYESMDQIKAEIDQVHFHSIFDFQAQISLRQIYSLNLLTTKNSKMEQCLVIMFHAFLQNMEPLLVFVKHLNSLMVM